MGYLDTPVSLDARLASVLGVVGPRAPGWLDTKPRTQPGLTVPEPIAAGMAELAGLDRPGTPEGVEALCQVVLGIQYAGLMDGEQPVYVVGGRRAAADVVAVTVGRGSLCHLGFVHRGE